MVLEILSIIGLGGIGALFGFAPISFWPVLLYVFFIFFSFLNYKTKLVRHINLKRALVISFAWSWVFGIGFFFAGLFWIAVALADFGKTPWVIAIAAVASFAAYLALWWGAAGMISSWIWYQFEKKIKRNWSHYLVAIGGVGATWILAEWGRSLFLTGFPWLMIGTSLAVEKGGGSGWLPIVGALGATGLLVIIAWLGMWRPRAGVVSFLVFFTLGNVFSLIEWGRTTGVPVTVTVIQTNISQDEKWQISPHQLLFSEIITEITNSDSKIIIFPETMLPFFWNDYFEEWEITLARIVEGRLVILGAFYWDDGYVYNTLVSIRNNHRYAKRRLVPFGEYIPDWLSWTRQVWSFPFSDQKPGAEKQPLWSFEDAVLSLNICYESAFSSIIANDVARGATLLVNASNFAWYGKSHGQWQHAQIGRARALETARPWVQSVNAGVSIIFNHRGETIASVPVWQKAKIESVVFPHTGKTPFMIIGGEKGIISIAILFFLLGISLARNHDFDVRITKGKSVLVKK